MRSIPSASKAQTLGRRREADALAARLQIKTQHDWYRLTHNSLLKSGAQPFLNKYRGSLSKALQDVYPEFEWKVWMFNTHAQNLWKTFNKDTKRECMDWIAEQIGIETQHDWYKFTSRELRKRGVPVFLSSSLLHILQDIYPEFEWYPWLVPKAPTSYWKNNEHQRKYCDWLAFQLCITTQQQWYRITWEDVEDFSAYPLLKEHNYSVFTALQNIYVEYEWKPWLFSNLHNVWDDVNTQREYFHWLSSQLGLEDNWNLITTTMIKEWQGGGLLHVYNGSLMRALKACFPEYNSTLTLEERLYRYRSRLDWIGEVLGIQSQDDWYLVSSEELSNAGGEDMLHESHYSLHTLLKCCYPEYQWYPWLFQQSAVANWNKVHNHREYFEWLSSQLQIQRSEDWYNVSLSDLKEMGANCVLKPNKDSTYETMKRVYPEFTWKPWMFQTTQHKLWSNLDNQRQYLEWLGSQIGVKNLNQWSQVSRAIVHAKGGRRLMHRYGDSLKKTLLALFPEHSWSFKDKSPHGSFGQLQVSNWLKKFVENTPVNIEHKLRHPHENKTIELDIYVPELSLAIEYQGAQHYQTQGWSASPSQLKRDHDKRVECERLGISLIEIPFWWKNSPDSLHSTLIRKRPDLHSRLRIT